MDLLAYGKEDFCGIRKAIEKVTSFSAEIN
jgi:hypothetical protein